MMDSTAHPFTRHELDKRLEACRGRTLGEVDSAGVFKRHADHKKVTGIAGDVIEQSVLGYPPDTRQEPDLLVDGVETELKTTGVRKAKRGDGYEAKEPMSITAVSLKDIAAQEFDTSYFWHKLEHMLLVYYLYDSAKTVPAQKYADFPILGHDFHEFSEDEKRMLAADWMQVRNFVAQIQENYPAEEDRRERYPLLSSALRESLMLIDTAPKFPNKPRFRLKRATVNTIVSKTLGNKTLEKLPDDYSSFEEIDRKCWQLAAKYSGMTVRELLEAFNLPIPVTPSKKIGEQLAVLMFGGTVKKLRNVELFSKVGLVAKTVVLTEQGTRTEDMKLFPIDFEELAAPIIPSDEEPYGYEASALFDYLNQNQLLCIVFTEPSTDASFLDNIFEGFKRIPFLENTVQEEGRRTWEEMHHLVANDLVEIIPVLDASGEQIINKTGVPREAPNFPKSRNHVIFARGTSSDSRHKPLEVNGLRMYRQDWWIQGKHIARILNETNFLGADLQR